MSLGIYQIIYSYFFTDSTISEYASLGPKNYQIRLEDPRTGSTLQTKIRGFALRSACAKERLGNEKFVDFVKSLLEGKKKKILIPQFNILRVKDSRQLYSVINHKLLRNDIYRQRVAFYNSPCTLPYGWNVQMYELYVSNNL